MDIAFSSEQGRIWKVSCVFLIVTDDSRIMMVQLRFSSGNKLGRGRKIDETGPLCTYALLRKRYKTNLQVVPTSPLRSEAKQAFRIEAEVDCHLHAIG
jgi:hypothetical protein